MLNRRTVTNEEPFLVFQTEDEFKEAVLAELEKMQDEEKKREGIFDAKEKLLREEAMIKEQVPQFDLRKMLREDPEFRERILKGYSVEEAFYLSNRKKNSKALPKKRIGMRENGKSRYMGTGTNRNVSNMSDSEFKKYIDSIKGSKF